MKILPPVLCAGLCLALFLPPLGAQTPERIVHQPAVSGEAWQRSAATLWQASLPPQPLGLQRIEPFLAWALRWNPPPDQGLRLFVRFSSDGTHWAPEREVSPSDEIERRADGWVV
ncbi:MAG: hypothetical protein D6765_00775, partial [Bacteroidetes bacterium]